MQFKFLLPIALRERIEAAAAKNRRSVSGEIIFALEKAYPDSAEDFGPMFQRLFDELMEIADRGDHAGLQARVVNANLALARAGHGKIEFYVIPGPPLGVGSRNVDVAKRMARIEEAANGLSHG